MHFSREFFCVFHVKVTVNADIKPAKAFYFLDTFQFYFHSVNSVKKPGGISNFIFHFKNEFFFSYTKFSTKEIILSSLLIK